MNLDIYASINTYLNGLSDNFSQVDSLSLNQAAQLIISTLTHGKTIYVCGNGGSGANASHIVVDYLKCLRNDECAPRILALVDNTPTVTAVSNDITYDDIFAYQLEAYLNPGDLLWCLTGSGNSKNILRAIEVAKTKGNKTLLFCGYDGGAAKKAADCVVHYPSHDMQKCEDSQMIIANVIMQQILQHGGLKNKQ